MRKCGLVLQLVKSEFMKKKCSILIATCIKVNLLLKKKVDTKGVGKVTAHVKFKLVCHIVSSSSVYSVLNTSDFTLKEDVYQVCRFGFQLLRNKINLI